MGTYPMTVGQLRPQHFLYFLPEPQGQGSLRPTLHTDVGKDDKGISTGCNWPVAH